MPRIFVRFGVVPRFFVIEVLAERYHLASYDITFSERLPSKIVRDSQEKTVLEVVSMEVSR